MKKLFTLFALFALALVSCEEPKKTDEPSKENPGDVVAPVVEFQITSENPMIVGAEGGELVIKYAITNPDESLSVTATTDAEWISESDALNVPENEIHFVVAANNNVENRTATIVVSYDKEYEVVVTQASWDVPPTLDPEFTIISTNPILAVADGGWYYFQYELINPVEGVSVEAECDAEWITELEVDELAIYLTVLPNRTAESRSATIVATYGDIKHELVVNQGCDPNLLPYLSGIYFGNAYGNSENDYNYSLAIATAPNVMDVITGETSILEGNKYLFLDLYASEPAENYNVKFTVPAGEYIFDIEDSAVAGTLGAMYTSYYDATGEGAEVFFVSGKVVVTESRIDAELVGEDGNVYTFFSEQTFVDNSKLFKGDGYIGDFTTLESDLNISFEKPSLYAECHGDYYVIGKDLWVVSIDDYSNGWNGLELEILTPIGEYPIGEFEISSDLSKDSMVLPGFLNSYGVRMWSWYLLRVDSYDVVGMAALAGGEISIVDNDNGTHTATFAFQDRVGHNITGECTTYYEYGATRSGDAKRFVRPARK